MLGQEIQEKSSIPLFNEIGELVKSQYHVVYFKSLFPKLDVFSPVGDSEITYEYLHYIHMLTDEGVLKLSIYYDKGGIGSCTPYPHYELYDGCEIERYFSLEEESCVMDRVKERVCKFHGEK